MMLPIPKNILVIIGVVSSISLTTFGQEVDSVQVQKLLSRYACKSCHFMDDRPVGPGWIAIAERNYSKDEFINLIENPKPENWPDYPAMAPMGYVPDKDLEKIYNWVRTLNKD